MTIRISTDASDVDLDWLYPALSERAPWALGRSREEIARSIEHSLCFSAFDGTRQVGFARVVTDLATFAWVCDVFVDEADRGQGIGRRLLAAITDDDRLSGLKRMLLVTDASPFYRPFGFEPLRRPERWLLRATTPGE